MGKVDLVLVLLLLCFGLPAIFADSNVNYEYLKVPVDDFVASVRSTIKDVDHVTSLATKLHNASRNPRVSYDLHLCLDMFDSSSETLGWILDVSLNTSGANVGTGDMSSDLRTWLSSVLVNQDTCMTYAFKGHKHARKTMAAGTSLKKRLKKISSTITKALEMVKPTPPKQHPTSIPPWLKARKVAITKQMANVVVALDGTGKYKSINEAVAAAPEKSDKQFVIYVKGGVYKEYVIVPSNKWNIVMVGDGMGVTVITGDRSTVDGYKTINSATFVAKGRGFIGQDMTFENTAGPGKHQAVAFLVQSDLSVLYRCSILGYQDTLYAFSQRQFFKRCEIQGTVDFIFGRSSAVFQHCNIVARKGLAGQKNTITAQSRQSFQEVSAFSMQFCTIAASSEVTNSLTKTYLGRPWQAYSTTMIMQSELSAIDPQGWLEWAGNFALNTLYYAEYANKGPGADVSKRVNWPGYHVVTDRTVADKFTVGKLIAGDTWLPATGIEYVSGLV